MKLKKLTKAQRRLSKNGSKNPQLIKLDIACGQNKKKGFTGIDIAKVDGVDIIHDLTKFPWPFEDNSVGEAFCSHYVEHTPDLIAFMNEVYRILAPGAQLTIHAPYYTSMRCWQDPTHLRAISEASFLYYNKGWREANRLTHYPITCDFDFTYGYVMGAEWAAKSPEAQQYAIAHYWNVVSDITVTLTKKE